jgi:hypothetical protein
MFLFHPLKSGRAVLKAFDDRLHRIEFAQRRAERRLEYVQEALGRIEVRQLSARDSHNLNDYELRVFSQSGEDGIIQYLVRNLDLPQEIFVEFGVQDYRESNTRFLLMNNNWSGLVLDGDAENIASLRKDPIYWAYDLRAVEAFITRDNINDLLRENGITGEIGLLSIDIDGNDFWVWQAIDVINPVIVVVEYNHRFGNQAAVTIPYRADFDRKKAPQAPLYFGASLPALCWLAERKGYAFVGCCSNGVNAFFVRRDKRPAHVPELTLSQGYREGKFSESVDERGQSIKRTRPEEQELVMGLGLVDVSTLD